MPLFKKRESLVSNIAYMAIMAAINVIFVLMSTFIPMLMLLLIVILPLTSTIVALFCNKKYFVIYLITTISLCMIVTFWNLSDTFFYVIPSIFSGFIFAILIEKRVHNLYAIFFSSLIYFIFTYAFVPLINKIYGINIINSLIIAFGLKDFNYIHYIVPVFIYFLALTQSSFSTFFIKTQLPKLGYEMNSEIKINNMWIIYLINSISLILFIIFAAYIKEYCFIFLAVIAYFSIYLLIELLLKVKTYIYIVLGIFLILEVFIFAFSYKYIPNPLGISLIGIIFILINIFSLLVNYLFNK